MSDITNIKLAKEGQARIDWAGRFMPVLKQIEARFKKQKPLKGINISACLHVTTETANLMHALKAGGAHVVLCASNPLSTQDETAAALVKSGIEVHARRGENNKTYYKHVDSALKIQPHVTMDDGADLVSAMHQNPKKYAKNVIGSTEETTTGVIRLRALAAEGKLLFPAISVNDSMTKHFFDNRYGTGQSTLDGVLRATNVLLSGSVVVVAGYGWCGRGLASRAKGLGAHVIVTEVDSVRALEAAMDGFEVMPMEKAAPKGDVFITVTGNCKVIYKEVFQKMKDGAIVCNSGHFDSEIDLPALKKLSKSTKTLRPEVEEYTLKSGKHVIVLSGGRLVNLSSAEGHPAEVMDMSFANQALAAEWLVKHGKKMKNTVHQLPERLDQEIAGIKLKSKSVRIDKLTPEQKKYLSSWDVGT